jgi:hypothetical protein
VGFPLVHGEDARRPPLVGSNSQQELVIAPAVLAVVVPAGETETEGGA